MTADASESNGRGPNAVVEEGWSVASRGSQDDHKNSAVVGKEEEGEGAGCRIQDVSPEKKVVPDSEGLRVDSPDSGGGGDFVCVESSTALDDDSALQASAVSAVTATEEKQEEEQREEERPVEGCEGSEEKDENRELIMDNGGSHQEQDVAVVLSREMKAAEAANAVADEKAKVSGHAETAEVENSGDEDSVELGEELSVENSVSKVHPISVDGPHEATPNSTSSATDDGQANSASAAGDRHESQERIVVINGVSDSAPVDDTRHEAPNSTVSETDDESAVAGEQESWESEPDGAEDSNSAAGEVTTHKVERADADDVAEPCGHIEVDAAAMTEEKLEAKTVAPVANGHEQSESGHVEAEEEEDDQKRLPEIKREQEREPEQPHEAVTADSETSRPATEVLSANQPQKDINEGGVMNAEASPPGTEDESNDDACSKEGDEVHSIPIESKRTYASVVTSGSQLYSNNPPTKYGHFTGNLGGSAVAKHGSFSINMDLLLAKVADFEKLVAVNTRTEVREISELQKQKVEGAASLWNNDHESQKQSAECKKQSAPEVETFDRRPLGPDKKAPSIPVQSTKGAQPVTTKPSEVKTESSTLMDSGPFLPVARKKRPAKPKNHSEATSKEPTKATVAAERNNKSPDDLVKVSSSRNRGSTEKSTRKAEERTRKEEELEKERIAAELEEKLRLEQRAKAQEAEERKKRRTQKAQVRAEQRAQKEAELKEKKKAKKDEKKALAAVDTTEGDDDGAGELPTFEKDPAKTAEGSRGAAATSSKRSQKFKRMDPLPAPLRNRSNKRMRTWLWALLTALAVLVLFLSGDYISTSTFKLPSFGF